MFVPNFKILGAVVPEKFLTQISLCITLSERWKKKAKFNLSILVFFPTIYLPLSMCIQNLKILALIGAEKSVTENLTERERKMDK